MKKYRLTADCQAWKLDNPGIGRVIKTERLPVGTVFRIEERYTTEGKEFYKIQTSEGFYRILAEDLRGKKSEVSG